ncbi:MAG: rhodanese-like domain-containing protein [Chloroflexota bacterium]
MFFNPLPEIDAFTLAEKLNSDEEFILLDVREADELQRAKIDDRRLVHAAMSELSVRGMSMLPRPVEGQERSVYILCHHGIRSTQVTHWLVKMGWINVFNVRGGIDEYARKVDRSVGMY